jgi:HEXXH motif-containing protein
VGALNASHSPPAHWLARAHFDALAAGGGSPATVTALRSTQLSKRILLVHAVAETARTRTPRSYAAAGCREALAVLTASHRAAPDAVAEVLLYPQVGAWAMRCLRRLSGPAADSGAMAVEADLGHFGAVAAAAAVRAGQPFETTVRVRAAAVVVPTFGLVRVGARDGWARARGSGDAGRIEIIADGGVTVTVTASRCAVRPAEEAGRADLAHADGDPGWLPLRRLRSTVDGHPIDLAIDDLDQFRGFGGLSSAGRLTAGEAAEWQDRLDDAWTVLVHHDRNGADALAAGLSCLVPLDAGAGRRRVNATSADSVGAVGLTPPDDGLGLAVTFVHEFQHTKLLALLDVLELCGWGGDLHYSPWRSDPRPVSGLFQGAYAYLGVTAFWRDYRLTVPGARARLAHFEFARWREALRRTLGVLRASRMMTELGTEFLAGMAARSSGWSDEPVPAIAGDLALDVGTVHWTSWRLRNLRPDPARVAVAAEAWLADRPNPHSRLVPATVMPAPRGGLPEPHLELAHLRLLDPERFGGLGEEPGRLAGTVPDASWADYLLVTGDYAAAMRAYRAELARSPDLPGAWTGLAISHRRLRTPDQRVLVSNPEVVRAVHRQVRDLGDTGARPEAVAAWLAAAG